MSAAEAESIKGRLQYTRSQTFGRAGAVRLQALTAHVAGRGRSSLSLQALLNFWVDHFSERKPRIVKAMDLEPAVVIFTDGAVEPQGGEVAATIGGVMFDHASLEQPVYFSASVSQSQVNKWASLGTKHPVFLAELLPLAVAAATWSQELQGRRAIMFLDNEAARCAVIRGYSPGPAAAEIISGLWVALPGQPLWRSQLEALDHCRPGPNIWSLKTGRCGHRRKG